MTEYGLLLTGFNPKTAVICSEELQSELIGIQGFEDASFDSDEPWGQFVGIMSERESKLWMLGLALSQSISRASATGVSLANTAAFIGEDKIEASKSQVTLTLINRSQITPVTVPEDYQARQSSTSVAWSLNAAAEIPAFDTALEDLAVDTLEFQTGTDNTVRAYLGGSPDLSGMAVNWEVQVSGSTNSSNDGRFFVTDWDVAGFWVEYPNLNRADDTDDEDPTSPAIISLYPGVNVLAESLNTGPFEASIGSINTIVTPLSGWDDVYNQNAATPGTNEEKDDEFRIRLAEQAINSDGGTLAAVKEALEKVDGVTYVFGEENRSNVEVDGLKPNSMHFIVVGGTDQDIIDTIGRVGPAGIDTNGTETGTYDGNPDDPQIISFDRVTEVNPYFILNLTVDPAIWSSPALIAQYKTDCKTAMESRTYAHGEDLVNHLLAATVSVNVRGILTIALLQGLSPSPGSSANISIPGTEVVNITADRITVNAT